LGGEATAMCHHMCWWVDAGDCCTLQDSCLLVCASSVVFCIIATC
jgi:hypothetical protein